MNAQLSKDELYEARQEAREWLLMVRRGKPVAEVRAMIRPNAFTRPDCVLLQRKILLHFDLMCAYLSHNRKKPRKLFSRRVHQKNISVGLQRWVMDRLLDGWSHHRISKQLPVGYDFVRRVAKQIGAAYKKMGRGRRLTQAFKEQILADVRAGMRSCELTRKYGIEYSTTVLFRRMVGDTEDRRYCRHFTDADIAKATELLKTGQRWYAVANEMGVSERTLSRHVPYRRGDRRRLFLSDDELAAILADRRAGMTQKALSEKYGHHTRTIQRELEKVGMNGRTYNTP